MIPPFSRRCCLKQKWCYGYYSTTFGLRQSFLLFRRRKGAASEIDLPSKAAIHRLFHRAEDVFIPRAAAQVAGEELSELIVCVKAVCLQDLDRRHHKARRAEAALDGGFFNERLLNVAQLTVGTEQAFERADVLALRPDSEIDAGVEGLTVDEDIASAALADLAALFHGGHVVVVAQHIGERSAHVDHFFNVLAV